MAILIKGMEIPKCCDDCKFVCWSNLHQTGSCYLLDSDQCFDDYSTEYRTRRSEHCPLIEVPEPHGRLGDLDALKDKWTHKDLDLFSQGWIWLRDLNRAPTIIPSSDGE